MRIRIKGEINMKVLFDLKLENGEVLEGVYFAEAKNHLSCFYKDGEEVLNKNINNAVLIRVYDSETGKDITDYYKFFINAQINLNRKIYRF